jgi:hypothetical protein
MIMDEKESPIRKERRASSDRRKFNDPNYKGPERRSGQNRRAGKSRREYFRIIYPLACRPKLIISGKEYDVIDISEHGIRFTCKEMNEFQPGLDVNIKVTFNNSEPLDLKGIVLRIDKKIAVMSLTKSIPLDRIIAEQRYIKLNYPDYF